MEAKLRDHIRNNLDDLICNVKYDKFLNGCLRTPHLLTNEMRFNLENIQEKLSPEDLELERHKRLWKKLTQRGPDAYQQIRTVLSQLGFDKALQILDVKNPEYVSISSNKRNGRTAERPPVREPLANIDENQVDGDGNCHSQSTDEVTLEEFKKWEQIADKKKYEVILSKELHVDNKVGSYSMKSRYNRGVVFIVNIIDFPNKKLHRDGAIEDSVSLLHLFRELGFKLYSYKNLTRTNFFTLLAEILNSENAQRAECFVLVLMSHGNMVGEFTDYVQFHDGAEVKVQNIIDCFENNRCRSLLNKPKILIFPFCRGEISERGHIRPVQTDGIGSFTSPLKSDMMICYASLPGFTAHRDLDDGAWYIQTFCELMAKHAHDTDFDSILKLIHREAGEKRSHYGDMQTGNYCNFGFNKQLYFNPGIWEESNNNDIN
ncbi:caspase Dronc [Teleopsis dalmanni]|uniref:caspase Dronc n=1 Tax=Teleopsis dalmanni TaxID=139649 RepID=UPI000D32ABED|nr:caspase Dronc [Teleopsis dalmanni]